MAYGVYQALFMSAIGVLFLGTGCSELVLHKPMFGYQMTLEPVRALVEEGRYVDGLARIDEMNTYDTPRASYEALHRRPVLQLERAIILQQLGRHREALQALEGAWRVLERGFIRRFDSVDIAYRLAPGQYQGPYLMTPVEGQVLHTLAMVSFLALGDWSGAKVEARRLGVLRQYYAEQNSKLNKGLRLPAALASRVLNAQHEGWTDIRVEPQQEGRARVLVMVHTGLMPSLEHRTISSKAFAQYVDAIALGQEECHTSLEREDEIDIDFTPKPQPGVLFPTNKATIGRLLRCYWHDWRENYRIFSARKLKDLYAGVYYGEESFSLPVLQKSKESVQPPMEVTFERWAGGPQHTLPAEASLDLVEATRHSWVYARSLMLSEAMCSRGKENGCYPDTRTWSLLPARLDMYTAVVDPGRHKITVKASRDRTVMRGFKVMPGQLKVVQIRLLETVANPRPSIVIPTRLSGR